MPHAVQLFVAVELHNLKVPHIPIQLWGHFGSAYIGSTVARFIITNTLLGWLLC